MTDFVDIHITGWTFPEGEPSRPDEAVLFHLTLSGKPPQEWARALYDKCRPLKPKQADDWVGVHSHAQQIVMVTTLEWMMANRDRLKKLVNETNAWYPNWLAEQEAAKKEADDLKRRLNFD